MSYTIDEQLANATVIVEELWHNNSKTHRDESLALLDRIFGNIKNYPHEARYHRVNLFKIVNAHSIVKEFTPLLLASGFAMNVDGMHVQLNPKRIDLCTAVYSIIKDRINYENELLEIERQKVIANSKQKQQQYINAQIRKKEAVKQRIASDRKDIQQEYKPTLSSKQRDNAYWKSHNIYAPNRPSLPSVDEHEKHL
mmetsp:Transcript_21814/g.35043  ORF Transcript_21814/g.35043 Transcript_21814/m.35043 type:complete len:197 (-) Transcript_21814:38-628(-)|eukprot:CAMPEP_0202714486 /NCGR_PEP_ID=MMETSP1385-20130828/74443_1 /ASSEMBLY_ACC=CAM_ASM_000861 /TAXON_ID=933848 /ORGANISM="Elphidium margaritaceum" /LENGTH=196 /DNA_ID=CAMNT_0049375307 /DNA_START=27 /DNA_END=617 /DNA_ORIENTATION=-